MSVELPNPGSEADVAPRFNWITEVETIPSDTQHNDDWQDDGQMITICSTGEDFHAKWITAESRDSWTYLEEMV